jgi:hypothetical protein
MPGAEASRSTEQEQQSSFFEEKEARRLLFFRSLTGRVSLSPTAGRANAEMLP